ncbi:unnamed protein product [Phytomonas sp. Hart1]|nr:unnamed protein product [Phytomonas sp. Hart1]|eukprot:CCW67092.1 unnamed protein product [Phytomonas sp. isolate Hart1]
MSTHPAFQLCFFIQITLIPFKHYIIQIAAFAINKAPLSSFVGIKTEFNSNSHKHGIIFNTNTKSPIAFVYNLIFVNSSRKIQSTI